MPADVKLGRLPAVADPRVPFLADIKGAPLPPLPTAVRWFAGVENWGMLGNDSVGDCVEAMAGHATKQWTLYAGSGVNPTTDEAVAAYSEITGYDPAKPDTDQGTLVMGPGGLVQFWLTKGLVFGGKRSILTAAVRVHLDIPRIQEAIYLFGGVGLGIDLPSHIVDGDFVPFVWSNPYGPIAGGHEVWVDGWEKIGTEYRFDLVSWGKRYRMTTEFLEGTTQEVVAFLDPDSLNARGVNPDGFDEAALAAAMSIIRAAA